MDLDLFFGRFHPLVVHFPIALLVAAALMEGLSKLGLFRSLTSAIPFILFLGAFTALMSVVLGWFIAQDRGYDDSILFWHRWLGVLVFIVATFLWLISINFIKIKPTVRRSLFVFIFFLVSFTGHLGGSLTHGENYLSEYAPDFLRELLSSDDSSTGFTLPGNPDSVIVFRDLIAPILNSKCTPCHNQTQQKGGLVLTTVDGIKKGGDKGAVVIEGRSFESELFRRVSLPPDHSKFMPVKDLPLSFAEVSIIKWWIDAGASYENRLTDGPLGEITGFLTRDFHYNPTPKPYYEITSVQSASQEQLGELRKRGFIINVLSVDNDYLSVSAGPGVTVLPADLLKELLTIREQITWLDLSGKNITDKHLQVVEKLSSLTKLDIHSNPVTDKGISSLRKLQYLETLNVFDTHISDGCIQTLSELVSLKRLYMWRTDVTPAGVENLLRSRPALQIDTGFRF